MPVTNLPLLHEMEEKAGGRRDFQVEAA